MYGIRMGNNHVPAVAAVSGRGVRDAIGTAAWRHAHEVQRDVTRRVVAGIQAELETRTHVVVYAAARVAINPVEGDVLPSLRQYPQSPINRNAMHIDVGYMNSLG